MPVAMVFTAELDGDGTPAGTNAVMPWWSFTKTLIAAAVLRLVDQGKVALDDELAGLGASPRALLQHRAGLTDYGGLAAYHDAVARGDDPWPEAAMLAKLPPRMASGRFVYSNVGYLHLRRLIEAALDTPFATALDNLVLRPLGLTARIATTREDMAVCAVPADRAYHPGWVYHGLIVGPVTEAAQALHRLLTCDFLSPSSRRGMLVAQHVDAPIEGRPWRTTGYGLGLMIGTFRADGHSFAVAGHSAGGPGSAGAVYHSQGRTVVAFTATPGEACAEHIVARRLAQR